MVHEDSAHLQIQHYSAWTQMKQAISGAASGFITRTFTQPLDVLKIRFQLQVEPVATSGVSQSKYTSIAQACRLIYREEGLLAFWKGHNAGQILTMTYAIMQFWSYEQIELRLRQYPYMSTRTNLTHFVAGGSAGCLGAIASMPFDVIRTRVVGQDHNQRHSSMFRLLPIIAQEEGVQGLFRGLGTTLLQIGPLIGFNFMFYHYITDLVTKMSGHDHQKLSIATSLLTGAASGVLSKVILYPLDFIKKRLQLQGFLNARRSFGHNQTCHGIIDCMKKTLQEEKISGFYKGMYPTLMKSGLTTAFYFSIYDAFKELLKVDEDKTLAD